MLCKETQNGTWFWHKCYFLDQLNDWMIDWSIEKRNPQFYQIRYIFRFIVVCWEKLLKERHHLKRQRCWYCAVSTTRIGDVFRSLFYLHEVRLEGWVGSWWLVGLIPTCTTSLRRSTSRFDWTQHATYQSSISWGNFLPPSIMHKKTSHETSLDLDSCFDRY